MDDNADAEGGLIPIRLKVGNIWEQLIKQPCNHLLKMPEKVKFVNISNVAKLEDSCIVCYTVGFDKDQIESSEDFCSMYKTI